MAIIEPEYKVIKQNSLDFHLRLEIAGANLVVEDLDIDVEDDYMQITFIRKEIEYDKSDYIIKIKNKTKNYIVLSDINL